LPIADSQLSQPIVNRQSKIVNSPMPYFTHDGLQFHFLDTGQSGGVPFVFQHGLGGDANQPLRVYQPTPGVRLLTLDCRAHGQTTPLGDESKLSLHTFAADLRAWCDYLRLECIVMGGISMGAAVALRFALDHPERVVGLLLSRPAWLDQPAPPNLAIYSLVARLIRERGAQEGLAIFLHTAEYQAILHESPDAASSLVGQFTHPRAEETVARLERIPNDAPLRDLRELQSLHVPTLVLANRQDPIHPYDYGVALAQAIPGAQFRALTPKSINAARHAADVQRHVDAFLSGLGAQSE
jgi:pimeloyl-ACP methyl ester carboxylesterase